MANPFVMKLLHIMWHVFVLFVSGCTRFFVHIYKSWPRFSDSLCTNCIAEIAVVADFLVACMQHNLLCVDCSQLLCLSPSSCIAMYAQPLLWSAAV